MKTDLNIYMGAAIRKYRKMLGLDQNDVAQLLEISRVQVCNLEKGNSGLQPQYVMKICAAFHCTPNDIYPPVINVEYYYEEVTKTVMMPIKKIVTKLVLKSPAKENED